MMSNKDKKTFLRSIFMLSLITLFLSLYMFEVSSPLLKGYHRGFSLGASLLFGISIYMLGEYDRGKNKNE